MDEKYNLEYIKRQIKDRENQQIGYELGVEQERERNEKLLAEKDGILAEKDGMLAEKDGMLAEKDAIIESLKRELAALSR